MRFGLKFVAGELAVGARVLWALLALSLLCASCAAPTPKETDTPGGSTVMGADAPADSEVTAADPEVAVADSGCDRPALASPRWYDTAVGYRSLSEASATPTVMGLEIWPG